MRKLILLVNDALSLNIEESATLLDDDLLCLALKVQVEQDAVHSAIDKSLARLLDRTTRKDAPALKQVLNSLIDYFVRLSRLERLEDGIKGEQFRRAASARDIGLAQAKILELTHTTICSYSRNSAA
ncbi:MAG: hypothetical protein ACYC99_17270 [Candidatus Geothermincolia bacterium]